jgi:inward rectifier potassium channel
MTATRSTADIAKDALNGKAPPKFDPNLRSFVRKGVKTAFHKDLYFFLVDTSWRKLLAIIFGVYFILNLFFASLYWIVPGSLSGAQSTPLGFWDCFNFSVQTIATIGYGVLHPHSAYGHFLVMMESAIGLFGLALMTGLIFSKFSHPKAGVLFSNVMTIHPRFGKNTLTLRVGNIRGNDVVDAAIHLTVLQDEITPEGDHLRRVKDLKLERHQTPFFSLSWTVTHVIDENSPLFGIDWTKPQFQLIGIMATLIAHDGTYGQTIYARKFYAPDDIYPHHRFVDVIHQMEDGRLMVDYDQFHQTIPIT